MKKLLVVVLLTLLPAATAFADQINFVFNFGGPSSVTATSAGLLSGPAALSDITDSTHGVIVPFTGTYQNGNTGAATAFGSFGGLVIGDFTAGGANSVLIEDSTSHVILAGIMNTDSTLVARPSNSTGNFDGQITVTFVDPLILKLFGLGPRFASNGSVALTLGSSTFDGTTFTAQLGGGSVTIETLPAVPEPVGLGVLGMGLLTIAEGLRRRRARLSTGSR